MRKTCVLQHVCEPKWLSNEKISFHQEHFPFEVLSFFSSLLGIQAILSHCESSLSGAVSLQWGTSQHVLLPRLLTVGRAIVQEVGCHFAFPFDLNHPTILQHVPFVCKHLVKVCSHLRAERKRQIYIRLYKYLSDLIKEHDAFFQNVDNIMNPQSDNQRLHYLEFFSSLNFI